MVESVALPLTTSARFADTSIEAAEAGSATVAVTRSGPGMSSQATLNYATTPGTASTSDYTATSGTLTFPPNVARASFEVPITPDMADEPDEAFTVTLSMPSPSINLPPANATGTVTINDNDDAPVTPATPSTPATPAPGLKCGKGTVVQNGECVAKKKKKKGKKKGKKGKK